MLFTSSLVSNKLLLIYVPFSTCYSGSYASSLDTLFCLQVALVSAWAHCSVRDLLIARQQTRPKSPPVTLGEVLEIAVEATKAVRELHAHSVLALTLAPSNILLSGPFLSARVLPACPPKAPAQPQPLVAASTPPPGRERSQPFSGGHLGQAGPSGATFDLPPPGSPLPRISPSLAPATFAAVAAGALGGAHSPSTGAPQWPAQVYLSSLGLPLALQGGRPFSHLPPRRCQSCPNHCLCFVQERRFRLAGDRRSKRHVGCGKAEAGASMGPAGFYFAKSLHGIWLLCPLLI